MGKKRMTRGWFQLPPSFGLCFALGFVGTVLPLTAAEPECPELIDLDRRYQAMLKPSERYGEGGLEVLEVAYQALRQGKADNRWPLVGLEDLWAEAIKEGAGLFNKPARRWGLTRAGETDESFGQSTVGPWQMTINNVRNIYGPAYGIQPEWTDWRIYAYFRDNPDMQAGMIADYIQEAYGKYGRRGPYGIQRYFSLKPFIRGQIGLAAWDKPVLPPARYGDWASLSPEMKADTGFYAKQVLLGTRSNPRGLLYWLWVTRDLDAIREALRTWRDQCRMIWDAASNKLLLTDAPGNFAIQPEDLKYLRAFPDCYAEINRLVSEVLAEEEVSDELD
jgi:hypothetical protein